MRDDGDFFKSTRGLKQVLVYFLADVVALYWAVWSFCAKHSCYSREGKNLRERQEALENQILMRHVHSGISSEVLIGCGHFIFLLYRYLNAT